MMNRRGFLGGLIGLVAAPAVVHAASLMPLRGQIMPAPTLVRINHKLILFRVLAPFGAKGTTCGLKMGH